MVVNEGHLMNEPTLAFACPVCGNPMLIPDSLRGLELQCPHEGCGAIFQTPALDEPVQHVDAPVPEEPAADAQAAGAKTRRKQLPKGPGLKRKGPPPGPRPTRTAAVKPAEADDNKPAPSPAAPPAAPAKKVMGTGTKLSYLLGVVIVVGAVIYNKTAKRAPAAGTPAPATTVQAPATPPARSTVAAPRVVAPVPAPPPAGKKKGREMSEEDRNRFNENLTKADEDKREEERKEFKARLERAETGSKTAQVDVGMKYLNGVGVEPDRTRAREWLEKAAAQKYAPAFNGLGEIDKLEGRRDEAIAHFVKAGDLCVEGFLNDEPKAKSVVYKALEQLDVLGAKDEHAALAAKTTRKDEPKEETAPEAPSPSVTPPAPEAKPKTTPPEPAPVLELPPLPDPPPPVELPPEPDPPPPAPAPDAPSGEIKEP
jgi:uncharacterized membrane protein